MTWAGYEISGCNRGKIAQKDGSGARDFTCEFGWVFGHDREMLGSKSIGESNRLFAVPRQNGVSSFCQDFLEKSLAG